MLHDIPLLVEVLLADTQECCGTHMSRDIASVDLLISPFVYYMKGRCLLQGDASYIAQYHSDSLPH